MFFSIISQRLTELLLKNDYIDISAQKEILEPRKSTAEVGGWLAKVDKAGLPGRFKAYQHVFSPSVLWPLPMCAVPITIVESLGRKICSFHRKWFGLPRTLNSTAPYGTSNTLQLPFSGLVEESEVQRTRGTFQYRDSKEYKVSSAGKEVRGREGSGGGRVMSKGTGGGRCNKKSRLGLLPKETQPGLGPRETPPTPGRGLSRCGGRACGQGSGSPTAGSMDKVGEYGAA